MIRTWGGPVSALCSVEPWDQPVSALHRSTAGRGHPSWSRPNSDTWPSGVSRGIFWQAVSPARRTGRRPWRRGSITHRGHLQAGPEHTACSGPGHKHRLTPITFPHAQGKTNTAPHGLRIMPRYPRPHLNHPTLLPCELSPCMGVGGFVHAFA